MVSMEFRQLLGTVRERDHADSDEKFLSRTGSDNPGGEKGVLSSVN